jgi:hypothetical protein
MALVWAVWGEREIRSLPEALISRREGDFQSYKIFQQIFTYKDGQVIAGNQSEQMKRDKYHGSDRPIRLRGGGSRIFKTNGGFLVISEKELFRILQYRPDRNIRNSGTS